MFVNENNMNILKTKIKGTRRDDLPGIIKVQVNENNKGIRKEVIKSINE